MNSEELKNKKLYELIAYGCLVDECGWVTKNIFSVWVNYYNLKEFLDKLKDIYGNYILEFGYTDCILLEDCIYIELNSLLTDEVLLEEIFNKEKFEH